MASLTWDIVHWQIAGVPVWRALQHVRDRELPWGS